MHYSCSGYSDLLQVSVFFSRSQWRNLQICFHFYHHFHWMFGYIWLLHILGFLCYFLYWQGKYLQHLKFLKFSLFFTKYSGCNWKVYKCCFMKQKCHFQRGLLQFNKANKALRSLVLSKEVNCFVFPKGAKKLAAIKIWMFIFP